MNRLVSIKRVTDMESKFKSDQPSTWCDRADLAWRLNEYDEYGVEQAVTLKEERGDADLKQFAPVITEESKNLEKEAYWTFFFKMLYGTHSRNKATARKDIKSNLLAR